MTEVLHADQLDGLRLDTDANGFAIQAAVFTPYGNRVQSTAAHEEPCFIGPRQDAETGLIFPNARYNDLAMARFILPDRPVPVWA